MILFTTGRGTPLGFPAAGPEDRLELGPGSSASPEPDRLRRRPVCWKAFLDGRPRPTGLWTSWSTPPLGQAPPRPS
ncbi:hypothetical protein ACRAWD_19550 [Caulobacter segnis]